MCQGSADRFMLGGEVASHLPRLNWACENQHPLGSEIDQIPRADLLSGRTRRLAITEVRLARPEPPRSSVMRGTSDWLAPPRAR